MFRKNYLLIILAVVIGITGLFLLPRLITRTAQPSALPDRIQTVKLLIDPGDGNPLSFTLPATASSTPYSLLSEAVFSRNWEISVIQYDFGVFVKSLLGKPSSADKAWIYYVNGQSGSVAADKQFLQPGDIVEWKYIKPD